MSIIALVGLSVFSLISLEPDIFPNYIIFLISGLILYVVFSKIDFSIYRAYAKHFYVASIILLAVPLIIGQVTRGAVRWIPLGEVSVQPSELVRPFLVLFMADYMRRKFTIRNIHKLIVLVFIPIFLILIQPSLGVAILTFVSFLGVALASSLSKKQIFILSATLLAFVPIIWLVLAPYQKLRVTSFLDPSVDPLGAGYNSIQSMISVGSGGLLGHGISEGVQTQLHFLPEKHTDFIFAAISEEMGFVGVALVLGFLFLILVRLIRTMERPKNVQARMYVSGIFLVILTQVVFNVGMNMGLFPISGIPLPLVSAGGSSFVATMVSLGIVNQAKR
ncbi:FtsW/RodA/SpoVE family cell cycle protein [Patescibacteria group bacterium]